MSINFQLISSAYLFCRTINNVQISLKVRNLKIVRKRSNITSTKQNSIVHDSKNRSQLPNLRTKLDLKWENSKLRFYTWYFHKLHEELQQKGVHQNRHMSILFICLCLESPYYGYQGTLTSMGCFSHNRGMYIQYKI